MTWVKTYPRGNSKVMHLGASQDIADMLYEFGTEFGRAFQLVDDLLSSLK